MSQGMYRVKSSSSMPDGARYETHSSMQLALLIFADDVAPGRIVPKPGWPERAKARIRCSRFGEIWLGICGRGTL